LRALTAALVVAVVTAASSSIGSFASGMFALFPIILGSSIIMHPRIGGKAVFGCSLSCRKPAKNTENTAITCTPWFSPVLNRILDTY
jgi:hypothetical protein